MSSMFQNCCEKSESEPEIIPSALDYVELLLLHLLQKLVVPLPQSTEQYTISWKIIRTLEDIEQRVLLIFPKISAEWAREEMSVRLANWRSAPNTRRAKSSTKLPLERIHKAVKEVCCGLIVSSSYYHRISCFCS